MVSAVFVSMGKVDPTRRTARTCPICHQVQSLYIIDLIGLTMLSFCQRAQSTQNRIVYALLASRQRDL